MDKKLGKRILDLRERIVSHFDSGDWEEIGFITGHSDIIDGHPRLLRSLSFGDQDYSGNVLNVVGSLAELDPDTLNEIDKLLDRKYPGESHFISAKQSPRKITFAPHVFEVPDFAVESDLVAVMMPFSAEFRPVHTAIKGACSDAGFRCLRADDIWEESTVIQDIFNLLLRAKTVIVDFTGRNANVMYETGIAHTLGKLVVPISQSLTDVPFDMSHHRVLKYLPNSEGYADLKSKLKTKLEQVGT